MRKFTALMIVSAIVMCTGCRANTSEGAGGLINTSASAADTSTAPAETEKTPTAEPEKTSTAEENSTAEGNSTLSGSGTSEKTPDGHFDIGTHSAIWRGADSYYVFYPDGTMSIEWSDGRTELFTPVNANAEEFTFYTNQELQYIALAYYGAQTGYYPQHSGVQSNDDGTASIQLYDIMEDHNSTSAWYTIDRVTLTGTDDISGDTVDMTAYADAAQQAYQ